MTNTHLKLAQDKDPDIGPVKLALKQRKVLKAGTNPSPQIALLLKQASKLVIQNELLYRVSKGSCGKEKKKLVLPGQFQQQVMYSLHDNAGHLGIERTTELVKDRFYWPQVTSEVEKYVKSCGRCVKKPVLGTRD